MAVEFNFLTKSINNASGSTLVLFASTTGKDKKLAVQLKGLTKDSLSVLSDLASDSPFKGNLNDSLFLRGTSAVQGFKNVALVGIGDLKKADHEIIRRASAVALKTLKAHGVTEATVAFESISLAGKDKDSKIAAIFDGFYLADYSSDLFKSKKEDKKLSVSALFGLASSAKSAQKIHKDSLALCESINFSRSLGDTPGNKMNPVKLAEAAKKAAEGTGLKVTVWDDARIKKEKMGCFHSVSLGGGVEPRLIIMEYKGGGSKKPICYVGKGLTFDSGGICIKPGAGMDEMKFDMCGGANVIGTMLAIAKLKLKVNVIGIVPASENMPGPMANKPGDIVTARNGKTVEVINTDAEGRLILSDALVYASEQEPQFIVDAATLTGAMVIALGDTHTGFFSRDDKLTQKIKKAASSAGELVWEMPMHEEHAKDMKGAYADLQNVTARKGAGSAHGAVFLAEFVDSKIPWAHFDIAGTAWNTGHRIPYNNAKGASGCMIRTFVELAKQHV